jgi:hypothetical protein
MASVARTADGGLRLTAKVGEIRKFKMTAVVKFQDQDLNVTGDVSEKIVHVDDAGLVTVQLLAMNTKATAGGQDIPVPDSPALTAVYRSDGTLSELRGENASQTSYRLETLTSVKLPSFALAVDKTWTWDVQPNSKVGIQKASVVYKVLGEDNIAGHPSWKVSRAIRELEGDRPATSDGTIWIDKLDGTLVKQVDDWKNAPVPNAPSAVNGVFTLELQPIAASASAHPGA